MSHFYLILAIFFEVIGTTSMKLSKGFTILWPSISVLISYLACIFFLTLALRNMQISVAYSVWGGVGTLFISLVGFIYFKEPMNILKCVSIALIILGVIGLNIFKNHGIG